MACVGSIVQFSNKLLHCGIQLGHLRVMKALEMLSSLQKLLPEFLRLRLMELVGMMHVFSEFVRFFAEFAG